MSLPIYADCIVSRTDEGSMHVQNLGYVTPCNKISQDLWGALQLCAILVAVAYICCYWQILNAVYMLGFKEEWFINFI